MELIQAVCYGTLLSKNLVKIKGRDAGPGRPLLYSTTDKYLEYFGLNNLSEMPKITELVELEQSIHLMEVKQMRLNKYLAKAGLPRA